MLNKKWMIAAFVAAATMSTAASADDRGITTVFGAITGAAIGNHFGGRDGAIVGGVLGAVVGANVNNEPTYYERPQGYYRSEPAVTYYQPAPAYYSPATVYVGASYRGRSEHDGRYYGRDHDRGERGHYVHSDYRDYDRHGR